MESKEIASIESVSQQSIPVSEPQNYHADEINQRLNFLMSCDLFCVSNPYCLSKLHFCVGYQEKQGLATSCLKHDSLKVQVRRVLDQRRLGATWHVYHQIWSVHRGSLSHRHASQALRGYPWIAQADRGQASAFQQLRS